MALLGKEQARKRRMGMGYQRRDRALASITKSTS